MLICRVLKTLLLLSILTTSFQTMAADYVYVYSQDSNVSYTCKIQHFYVDTEGYGTFFANMCKVVDKDPGQWPVFPPMYMYMSLSGDMLQKSGHCLFVAHANTGTDTSTVLDCRPRPKTR